MTGNIQMRIHHNTPNRLKPSTVNICQWLPAVIPCYPMLYHVIPDHGEAKCHCIHCIIRYFLHQGKILQRLIDMDLPSQRSIFSAKYARLTATQFISANPGLRKMCGRHAASHPTNTKHGGWPKKMDRTRGCGLLVVFTSTCNVVLARCSRN